ncbi:transposase [Streptomyces sp. TLI_105]|uniref:transposase n=1 Tax=Streptomyces sp. TLI_105 TaxID=1881019 RepID=UPI000899EB7D|nr:transposase [Streptomyces sp. TLI_105]SEB63503.1 Transposase [Streptomyces sp. TLI_105]
MTSPPSRGHHYGTVLIDYETGRPLDLLTGRGAATLAGWLREHPGPELIRRGRAGSYADGARTGAPGAVQVADRFHLWQNLATAVEVGIRLHGKCLQAAVTSPDAPRGESDPADGTRAMSPVEARIRERHATIHALPAQGHDIRGLGYCGSRQITSDYLRPRRRRRIRVIPSTPPGVRGSPPG